MAASVNLSPAQRRERALNAYLVGAVKTVIRRVGDLTPEMRRDLLSALNA